MKRMAARLRTVGIAVGASVLMALPALAQQGPGPGAGQGAGPGPWHGRFMHPMFGHHHMMGWHHHGGLFVLGAFVHLLALIGLIAVIIFVVRLIRHGSCHMHHTRSSLEILEGRYARSEISHDEFVEKKRDLLSRR